MGAYMSEPVTDTCSDSGSNGIVTYGASAMQGWRTNQEDAHNAILDFDTDACLFAVYDGHGGAEVSDYTAQKFPDFLKAMALWKEGKFGEALETAFIQFDEHLTKEEVVEELRRIAGIPKKEAQTDGETHEDKAMLFEEAGLPIGEVLKKYGIILGNPEDYEQSPTSNLKKKNKRFHGKSLPKPTEDRSGCNANPSVADDKENVAAGEVEDSTKAAVDNHTEPAKKHKGKPTGDVQAQTAADDSDSKDSNVGMPEFKRPRTDDGGDLIQHSPGGKDSERPGANDIPSAAVPNGIGHNGAAATHNPLVNGEAITERHLELIQSLVSECETVVMGCSAMAKTIPSAVKSREAEDINGHQASKQESPTPQERTHTKSESLNEEETVFKSETSSWTSLINLHEVGRQANNEEGKVKGGKSPVEKVELEESEESSDDPEYNEIEADASSDMTGSEGPEGEESGDEDEEETSEDEDVEEPDEEMFPVPTGDNPGVDSGTTACVVVVKGKTLYVANAGDSRIVLCRAGQAVDLSVDHKPEDQIEKDRIENAGGKITADGRVNGGLNLSRAIGDHFYKQNKKLPLESQMISALPDIRVEQLTSDDSFMVLACDGIWNSLTSQEVVDFVKGKLSQTMELSKICEQLCERCLAPSTIGDGTGCDNMTAIVVDLSKLVSSG